MAYTKLQIVNRALGMISGAGDQINGQAFLPNLTGSDAVTNLINTVYDQIRQQVITDLALRKTPFRETVKYADLGAEVDTDLPEIGAWEYVFELPDDCFIVVMQFKEDCLCSQKQLPDYQWEKILNSDGDGWLFLTNTLSNIDGDSAYIQYCIDQDDESMWSAPFASCVSCLLAAEIAPIINKNDEARKGFLAEYNTLWIPLAKRFNQSQYNYYARGRS